MVAVDSRGGDKEAEEEEEEGGGGGDEAHPTDTQGDVNMAVLKCHGADLSK